MATMTRSTRYALLGPMGTLPRNELFYCHMNPVVYTQYKTIWNKMFFNQLTDFVIHRHVVEVIYKPLLTGMDSYMNIIVPQDSKRLLNALQISLRDHAHKGNLYPFEVWIDGGNVRYGKVANNMPNEWLKHPGTHGTVISKRYGRKVKRAQFPQGHALYDPDAKTHFFEDCIDKGRDIAQIQWNLLEPTLLTYMYPIVQYKHPSKTVTPQDLQVALHDLIQVRFG